VADDWSFPASEGSTEDDFAFTAHLPGTEFAFRAFWQDVAYQLQLDRRTFQIEACTAAQ